MFKYNNNHIFTGYLKQLLSSFSLPACKVYTQEFAKYLKQHGQEDPRVLRSFDQIPESRPAARVSYLKNNELYQYFCTPTAAEANLGLNNAHWRKSVGIYYSPDKNIPGLTRHLDSPGINYDTKTHEYLGDYLRFIRDYYNINLMSLYNCFTDKIYNNVYFSFTLNPKATKNSQVKVLFNAQSPAYRLYALPVKLFAEYTIAIDCDQGIEMFCGLYNTNLDMSEQAEDLAARTYQRVHKARFNRPFLYTKLNADNWSVETDINEAGTALRKDAFTRWDLTMREKDLKLFIKVPVSCKSSITILEGDYRDFNDHKYEPTEGTWKYQNNHCVLNFNTKTDKIDLNNYAFKPISQLQLLAFNTGESYPFATRLVEYLSGSVSTSMEEIPDNIKRIQKVMRNNGHYSQIEGLWENKIQNILYDYTMCSGPVKIVTVCADPNSVHFDKELGKEVPENNYQGPTKQVLKDLREGYYYTLGHSSKSTLFDILGYADKDVEKWYSSWKKTKDNKLLSTSLQNIDIYDGLYDF